MRSPNLTSQLQRLNELFSKTTAASGADIEIRSHWAKYLCVLCAGFLENAVTDVYGEFARRASSKPVADYAISILSKIQNPNAQKFFETANKFKPEWGTDLNIFLDSNGRREAINSIMKNRHEIAHGKYSGITLVQIRNYFDKAVEVVEFIENQCNS
jgi:hypothetical protein